MYSPRFLSVARPALARAIVPASFLIALSFFTLTGCGQRQATVGASASARRLTASTPVGSSTPDPTLTVRQSPLYKQAQQDCRAKQYTQAAALLEQLGKTPGLTPDATQFCRQQQAICLHDAGKPVPAATPAPVASVAAPALTPAQADCGPRALALACADLHRPYTLPNLRHAAGTTGGGTTLAGLASAAGSVGLKAKGEQVDLPALEQLSGPAIAWVDGNHYVAVLSVEGDQVTIHDPNKKGEEEIAAQTLLERSGGILLALSR